MVVCYLFRKDRSTKLILVFTIVAKVRQVCHIALRRDHEFINTVQEGTEETHSQVIVYNSC